MIRHIIIIAVGVSIGIFLGNLSYDAVVYSRDLSAGMAMSAAEFVVD